ncbi:Uncharacterised protein [Segatella copri]|nr:Uncharacterised protein [Segatella copri]
MRALTGPNLSALVKTMQKGTPLSPSQSTNSRSIFCWSWRTSMSTKTLANCWRCRI